MQLRDGARWYRNLKAGLTFPKCWKNDEVTHFFEPLAQLLNMETSSKTESLEIWSTNNIN